MGLGLLRAPQAPVVEGGIASGSHIPEGTQPSFARAARAVASALRPSDELLTVITGRNAGRDVGALAASAAVGARGHVVGEDVEVAVHAGGQEHPDVLIAIE